MAEEHSRNNEQAGGTARQESDAITTSDGAVRQLEKADLAATRPADLDRERTGEGQGEVIPLGKETGGAPEDAVADTGETSGLTESR